MRRIASLHENFISSYVLNISNTCASKISVLDWEITERPLKCLKHERLGDEWKFPLTKGVRRGSLYLGVKDIFRQRKPRSTKCHSSFLNRPLRWECRKTILGHRSLGQIQYVFIVELMIQPDVESEARKWQGTSCLSCYPLGSNGKAHHTYTSNQPTSDSMRKLSREGIWPTLCHIDENQVEIQMSWFAVLSWDHDFDEGSTWLGTSVACTHKLQLLTPQAPNHTRLWSNCQEQDLEKL